MDIGAYAFPTFGRKRSEACEGMRRILSQYRLDMLVAPEYTNLTLDEMLGLSDMQRDALIIPGSSVVRELAAVYNRAHVLKGGSVIHTYEKRFFRTSGGLNDFSYLRDDAVRNGSRPVLQKGTGSGVFMVGDTFYGIEICYDHEKKVLRGDGVKNLDYQIVVSAGMVVRDPSIVTKRGGAVILVDGGADGDEPMRAYSYVEREGVRLRPDRVIRIGVSPSRDDELSIFSV